MRNLSPRAGVVLALLLASSVARADDLTDLESILSEQVVTSASKHAESSSTAPALTTNLTAEDLKRYGIRTLGEAVDFLSVGVHSSDNLNGGEIGARGVLLTGDRGNHFLLLVDGHVMNDPLRGGAWFGVGSGIPIELIDHVEVVVGPGSVLYGSNAMLGIISVVTKGAKDYAGTRVIVESALPTSIRIGAGTGQKFTAFGEKGEITTQLQYFDQRGPSLYYPAENVGIDPFTKEPARTSRDPVGTGIWGGKDAKDGLYALAPSGIVRVSLGETTLSLRGAYYHHGAPTHTGDFDDPTTGEKEWRGSADLSRRFTVSTLLDVGVRLYGDYYHTRSDFITSRGALCPFSSITCNYPSEGTALRGGLEVQTTWDWFKDGRFVTILGGDGRAQNFQTWNSTVNADTGAVLFPESRPLDLTDGVFAAYLQQTWIALTNLRFNGGLRVDRDPRFDPVVTPRLAANWGAWRGGTIRVAYAEAFRAPSRDETDNYTAHRIKSEGLEPERVRSVEGTVEQKVGAFKMLLGGFYTNWSNLVGLATLSQAEVIEAIRNGETTVPYTPGVQLTQYRNVSRVENFGINAGIEGSIGYNQIQYGASITVAKAEQQLQGSTVPLTVAPRIFGNARIAYSPGHHIPTIAFAGHLLGPRPADRAFDGGFVPTPYAPTQAELRLTLSGDVPGINGLHYRALANYAIADQGPYVIGPVTSAVPTQMSATLNPVDRFRVTVGASYEF